jgi:hypothetical protein
VIFLLALLLLQSSGRPDCADVEACRQAALEAAAQQDYERFHDLAWRAVQKGRRNDPDLMYILARAQSLSGRPADALVMLTRLAQRGIPNDAATNDDFRRVRALPGWQALLASAPPSDRAAPASSLTTPRPAAPDTGAASPRKSKRDERANAGAIHFSTSPFVAAGLAYDGVSRRFIAGDRGARKLVVIDEPSHNVANLAGEHSAGFGEITALEIDRHEGDLWVASVDAGSSTLHRLQLVSGRVLYALSPPKDAGPARLVDVAVAPRSRILALDAEGRRLFALEHGSRTLRVVVRIEKDNLASVAPAGENVAYVVSDAGITRVDLATRTTAAVKTGRRVDLSGITRIRAYKGGLVGIQKTTGGLRAVRIRLNAAGIRVRSLDVLDADVSPSGESAASIAGDVFYYLSGAVGDAEVRRIKLR